MIAAAPTSEEIAGHVLFVDDDADVVKAAALLLGRHGLQVSGARNPQEAQSLIAAERVDVVLLDLNFSRGATTGEEGFRCLEQMLAADPQTVVVVITAHSGVSIAVRAMQAGAADFVMKPWNNTRLLAVVQNALALRRRRSPGATDGRLEPGVEPVILGESPAIGRVRDLVARAGPTGATVLLSGGAGLGKSLVARRLHLASPVSAGPFVTVELAGLAVEEAEHALFGAEPDATTGALRRAAGGTLVLDEVGELAAALQGRLAAVLERGGADLPRILSTSRGARAALQGRGGLRDALLYRLSTVEIGLPPLAERDRDAVLLAEHVLRLHARRHARPLRPLSGEAQLAILAAPWPGGVRELAQAAERCVIFADGPVYHPADLGLEPAAPPPPGRGALDLRISERALVAAALKRHGFNVSHAARELGLTRPALYRRMAKHGL